MAEDFLDVRFNQDDTLQIRGEEYEFKEGNVYALPHNVASKAVNLWDKGESVGSSYEVGEDRVDRKIGDPVESQSSNRQGSTQSFEDFDYNQLRSLASDNDLDASGTKEELIECLEDAGVEP